MRTGPTLPLATAAFEDGFREVEGSDPLWSTVHLAAASAWLVAMAISNAAEGACFGILAFVAAIRLPSTARLYPRLFRTGVIWVFLAFLAWQAASAGWSVNPKVRWSSGLQRVALVPVLLWPLAHRTAWLAGSVVVGGVLSEIALVAVNLRTDGLAMYGGAHLLGKDIGMTAASLSMACVTLLLGARPQGLAAGAGYLGLLAPIVGGLVVMSKRAEFIAIPVAAIAGIAQQAARGAAAASRRRLVVGLIGVVCVAAIAVAAVPRARITAVEAIKLVAGGKFDTASLSELTGTRSVLMEIALAMVADRPIAGWGAGSFEMQAGARCQAIAARLPEPRLPCDSIALLRTSHNMITDELCMRGFIGCAMLFVLVATLARWSWRDPMSAIALGMLALWCVHGMLNGTTVRGTHLACLALVTFRASAVEAAARR